MPEIIPAIIAKNFGELQERVAAVELCVETVQLDIMDGVFVPNKTWPYTEGALEDLEKLETKLLLETHLMVEKPEEVLDDWLDSKVERVILHYEAIDHRFCHAGLDPVLETGESGFNKNSLDSGFRQNDNQEETESKFFNLIKKVHSVRKEFGIALNPGTSIEVLDGFAASIDLVLLMGVNPGFSGQKFKDGIIHKVAALRHKHLGVKIGVDGGVNQNNAKAIGRAGADILIVGSAVFEAGKVKEAIEELRRVIES